MSFVLRIRNHRPNNITGIVAWLALIISSLGLLFDAFVVHDPLWINKDNAFITVVGFSNDPFKYGPMKINAFLSNSGTNPYYLVRGDWILSEGKYDYGRRVLYPWKPTHPVSILPGESSVLDIFTEYALPDSTDLSEIATLFFNGVPDSLARKPAFRITLTSTLVLYLIDENGVLRRLPIELMNYDISRFDIRVGYPFHGIAKLPLTIFLSASVPDINNYFYLDATYGSQPMIALKMYHPDSTYWNDWTDFMRRLNDETEVPPNN